MTDNELLNRLKDVGMLSDQPKDLGFVSTGSYALNRVITGRYHEGIPLGGITQFKGNSSSGKTVFVTHILREAQKKGYYAVLLDSENAYSQDFAKALGLDPERLIYCAPECIEEAFTKMDEVIKAIREEDKNTPIVIAYDSIAVSPTKKEIEGSFESSNIDGAVRAKVTGDCLRKINAILRPNKVALVVVNQVREKVGVMFGSPEKDAAGGRALEYYLHVDLKTVSSKTSGQIKTEEGKVIGVSGKVRNTKNKVSVPFQECEFELLFDKGLNPYFGLIPLLLQDRIITNPSKGWYEYEGNKYRTKAFNQLLSSEEPNELDKIKNLLTGGLTEATQEV